MKRWWSAALAAGLAWHGLTGTAQAQFPLGGYQPPIQQRPTVSPYLNLNRQGTQPGINYYGLVRPQMQTAQQLQNLQMQQGMLATEMGPGGIPGGGMIAPGQPVPTSTTGHPVYYFDYARYFPPYGMPNYGGYGGGYGGPGFGPGYGPGMGGGGLGAAAVNRQITTPGFGVIAR